MLNFAPTEEQEEICSLARSLALDHLRAQGRTSERDGNIAPSLLHTLAQTGLTAPFPEQLGGSGALEAVTYALIAEELGFGDGALAMSIIGSLMGPLAVWLAGDERQQQEYIPPFCDEKSASQARGSFAYFERTGGYQLADISATARREGDHYIVNGTKRDVMHGSVSSPRVVLLRLERTSGLDGLLALLVPAEGEGIQFRNDSLKLGMIAAPSTSYDFENGRIPASCQLGEAGSRGVIRAAALYNILRAGVACGMARAALEYARDYAKERIAFGRPIASYQGIAFLVAEMAMNLDAARLTTWRAATEWDASSDENGGVEPVTLVRDAEAAQHQAVKIARSATLDAIQILGGAGFIQDHPVEMWARNAAAME